MDGTQASSLAPPTPLGFQTIEQIQNMPSDLIKAKSKVNVIGFVKDYRPPVQSRGPDYKSTIEIMDLSIQYESSGLQVNIFLPLEKMPVVTGVSDVVLIRNIVVQMRHGAVSLLSNIASEFHVLEASKIPPSISAASTATWRSTPSSQCKRPTHAETCYVISANSHVNEIALPTNQEFQDKSIQAMNVKDKFGLLKDVKPNCYYNILGEVIRVWEGPSGAITVYLSDYTTNTGFFNYEWRGTGRTANPRDGDEYGYTNSKAKKAKEWPGPYGKMSIQLTLYDANADFVREQVKVGQWILLYNIRIKYGKMAQILEGSLHSEGDRILVEVMEMAEEPGDNDKRFKEGVHRKYDWWKKFNEQNKKNLDEEVGLGDKRKRGNEDPSKSNSKTRRKERRATAELKAARLDANLMKTLNLNENIKCNNQDQPITALTEILKPLIVPVGPENDQKLVSPFTNCKYRANVRVVDYFPHKIEDFVVGHRASELDMLSDYSGGEDTDPEEEMRVFKSGKGFARNAWEWRFALQVEDGSAKAVKERMWLIVDNHSAQFLLGLEEDATNLRADSDLLANVKEQLFKLWGNLEELRSAQAPEAAKQAKNTSPPPFRKEPSSPLPRRKAGDQPDLDSDNESENERKSNKLLGNSKGSVLKERSSNIITTVNPIAIADTGIDEKPSVKLSPNNKVFTCCIQQYGVKVDEGDASKANAGNGKRWQRVFGLFGTQIL